MQTKGIIIAGLAGGSGKSVVSVGLTAYFASRKVDVVPFKKGPDYIDAGWLAQAAGKPCFNLDPYLMSRETIRSSFSRRSRGAGMAIVEGNRGLYDGVNASGGYSTAELALILDLPVILVVNCTKTTRTVAAMVLGCRMLDQRLDIRGVILNHIATSRQRQIIVPAVEEATGIPVLGAVPRLKKDIFPMRHLGMVPHQEYLGSGEAVAQLAAVMADSVDVEAVEAAMKPLAADVDDAVVEPRRPGEGESRVKIGVIQDAAFQFYYAENLDALEQQGAELVAVNALEDTELPALDGLYIGGGFPETSAAQLAANTGFRNSVKRAAEEGLPIYAECGGLIYLGRSILIEGEEYPLANVFPVRFGMSPKPQAHGYTVLEVDGDVPFYDRNTVLKGHEFRYSTILDWQGEEADLVMRMERGTGFTGGRDGLRYNNVLALYTHVHALGTPEWAGGFIRFCRKRSGR